MSETNMANGKKEEKKIEFKYNLSVYWSFLSKYKLAMFFLLLVVLFVEARNYDVGRSVNVSYAVPPNPVIVPYNQTQDKYIKQAGIKEQPDLRQEYN